MGNLGKTFIISHFTNITNQQNIYINNVVDEKKQFMINYVQRKKDDETKNIEEKKRCQRIIDKNNNNKGQTHNFLDGKFNRLFHFLMSIVK